MNARFSCSERKIFMTNKVKYTVTVSSLEEFKEMVDSIEANQRNAESGTTDCSSGQDARLSNENRAFQPTGNPLGWVEGFYYWLKREHALANTQVEVLGGQDDIVWKNAFDFVLENFEKYRSQGGC